MRKSLYSIVFASLLAVAAWPAAAADAAKAGEEAGFFERYTNAAQEVILKGLQLVGINYRYGGNTEDSGLDCSGFVRLVFKDTVGTLLPRTSREMSQMGEHVDPNELKPGDLVFFNTMKRAFSHVGIYVGDNYFLHAPRPGSEIRLESMASSYWLKRYNGARRIIEK